MAEHDPALVERVVQAIHDSRYSSVADRARAVLDAITEDREIIELPEPDDVGRFWFREACYVCVDPDDQMIMTQRGTSHGFADDARQTAAALLAAARAAKIAGRAAEVPE